MDDGQGSSSEVRGKRKLKVEAIHKTEESSEFLKYSIFRYLILIFNELGGGAELARRGEGANRDSPSTYLRAKTALGWFNALIPCIPFSRPSTNSGQAPQKKGTMTFIFNLLKDLAFPSLNQKQSVRT